MNNHDHAPHIICPHCGYEWQGGWELGLRDGENEEMECRKCDKPFRVTMHVAVSYSTEGLK